MSTPTPDLPQYQVFAIRYATRDGRRANHFIGGDAHDAPMPMDYYLWLVRGAGRTIVVDTGFAAEVAARAISAKYANSVKVKGSSPYVVTVRPMSPDLPVRRVLAAAEGR